MVEEKELECGVEIQDVIMEKMDSKKEKEIEDEDLID